MYIKIIFSELLKMHLEEASDKKKTEISSKNSYNAGYFDDGKVKDRP